MNTLVRLVWIICFTSVSSVYTKEPTKPVKSTTNITIVNMSSNMPSFYKGHEESREPRQTKTVEQNITQVNVSTPAPFEIKKKQSVRETSAEKYYNATKNESTTTVSVKTHNTFHVHAKDEIWSDVVKTMCPKFKYGKRKFNLEDMIDDWQTAYYDLPESIRCFKIHIAKVTFVEKVMLKLKYGNHSGLVNWKECQLEIRSHTVLDRRHFLQGDNDDYGVLDNIVFREIQTTASTDKRHKKPVYILEEDENPDQWLVVNNLLLTRDCFDGGLIVFSRIPMQPSKGDIKDALKLFGEHDMKGKLACHDEAVVNISFDDDDDNL